MEGLLKHTDAGREFIFVDARAVLKPGRDGNGIIFEV
jgi:hypothetical protein